MFSTASVGTIDPQDVGKVVVAGPIVQLGYGIGGLEPPREGIASAARVSRPLTSATIRYHVPPEAPAYGSYLGAIGLQLLYRDGDGEVAATLMEVTVPDERSAPNPAVIERPLLQFESAGG